MSYRNVKAEQVHWVYSPEEWKIFQQKENGRNSLVKRLFSFFYKRKQRDIPEVYITPEEVTIGERNYFLGTGNDVFKRVNIIDSGLVNIMVIHYRSSNSTSGNLNEIRILVPKGKLKEAIRVQDFLTLPPV
ncbi:MAG: hypothetical protein JST10_05040 [Bacteroidetes bacterium]|nr:hypothetical protein [Bacteroidota bacterium]MBS1631920.1 hypothetical protein [Bacteroidota bacterium]